jgi:hypothetical protein
LFCPFLPLPSVTYIYVSPLDNVPQSLSGSTYVSPFFLLFKVDEFRVEISSYWLFSLLNYSSEIFISVIVLWALEFLFLFIIFCLLLISFVYHFFPICVSSLSVSP